MTDDKSLVDAYASIYNKKEKEIEQVDEWHTYLIELQTEIVNPPRTHRDGARSLYFKDPEGTLVQMIYHPPLAKN